MEISAAMLVVLAILVMLLAMPSGALGLGVAVVAAPILSFFWFHNTAVVIPASLVLNAVACAVVSGIFARRGLVAWKHALALGAIAAVLAPFGSMAARAVPAYLTWYVYLGAILFLVGHLLRPPRGHALPHVNWTILYLGSIPAGLVGGMTGIGPAFALMPGLVVAGMDVRHAAGTAALASILPSLTALVPYWPEAVGLPLKPVLILFIATAAGSAVGATYASRSSVPLGWQKVFAGFVTALAVAHFCTLP